MPMLSAGCGPWLTVEYFRYSLV
ncbi:unnamed protein product [Cuscuta epithymum]|uniref:Uncharacterized protein n=1 Tax=Cuscuta epithymum TaxID=186058 RepID=A0AAV0DXA7_9ASTE